MAWPGEVGGVKPSSPETSPERMQSPPSKRAKKGDMSPPASQTSLDKAEVGTSPPHRLAPPASWTATPQRVATTELAAASTEKRRAAETDVLAMPEIPSADGQDLKSKMDLDSELIPGDSMVDLKGKMNQWLTEADSMKQSLKKDTEIESGDKEMGKALNEAHQNDFNDINAKSVLGWRHERWLKEHGSKVDKRKWANAKKRDQRAELRKARVMKTWEESSTT